MADAPTPKTASAHAFLARAMARVEPSARAALLVEMLSAIPDGLAVIQGRAEAAEALYAAADRFATKAVA